MMTWNPLYRGAPNNARRVVCGAWLEECGYWIYQEVATWSAEKRKFYDSHHRPIETATHWCEILGNPE